MESINDYMPIVGDGNKERLEALKKLFPDLFINEGKLNLEEFKKVIDYDTLAENERYEFNWFGKSNAKRQAFSPGNATLILDKGRSVNPEKNQNLIIEGENLEVLKLLSAGYNQKVKCIYIDPPYNTGKDFVYSDNFYQGKKSYWEQTEVIENGLKIDSNAESDGRYHSNWLNMMYSRLLISRQLLKPDGIIFISIDDNEVHNLRKLCDEVFGEENFLGQVIWQTATDNNPTQIATEHEYVICYAKDKSTQNYWEIASEKGKIIQAKYEELKKELGKNPEEIQKHLRNWLKKESKENDLSGIAHYSYVDEFGVFYPGNSSNTKPGGYSFDIIHPVTGMVCCKPEFGYRWPEKTFLEAAKKGDVLWGIDETTIPKIKKRLNTATQKFKSYYYEDNRATTLELKTIFDGKLVFNNPKSVNFLKHVFRFVLDKDDLVLDFFAGSGSTGQAILEMNKEDKGERKFILIQLPEATPDKSEAFKAGYNKISDITIERNKRVIDKLDSDSGFKVFKLVKSNFPRVEFEPDNEKTVEQNIELLKKYISDKEANLVSDFNYEDLMLEIVLKNGFTLNFNSFEQKQFKANKIYKATDGEMEALICLDNLIEMSSVETLVNTEETDTQQKFICLERALSSPIKIRLKNVFGARFKAY